MKHFRIFVIALFAFLAVANAYSVTDKEMEEAKARTAKIYLRWSNDMSGYLDGKDVKSMSELNELLREKEKENLKAFNAVKTPSDYAGWDKEKLVEYWTKTFFQSPGLNSDGKRGAAIQKIKADLMTMKVSAPSEEPKQEEAKPEQPENPIQAAAAADTAVAKDEQAIMNEQAAMDADLEEAQNKDKEAENNTWVYIVVLVVLVAIVIWLVVYAANLMKRQPARQSRKKSDEDDDEALRDQARTAIAKKNEELRAMRERLQREENRNAELGMEIERMKLEHNRLVQQIQQLREQANAMPQERKRTLRQSISTDPVATQPIVARPVVEEPIMEVVPKPAPKPRKEPETTIPEPPKEKQKILNVIYLGRTNKRGIFVRADRRINPGNTIYRLDTNDGLVGTFHVVDEPEVVDTALSNPTEYLGGGCMGEDLLDTEGVTRILTVSAGTAIFENGYWKVLRKTQIRYE